MSRFVFILPVLLILFNKPQISRESKAKLPRYVVELDVKPAIVGSYKYDMIEGVFKSQINTTTELITEDIKTTSAKLSSTTPDDSFRKHVAVTSSFHQLNWWTHARFLKNFTGKIKPYTNRADQTVKVKI